MLRRSPLLLLVITALMAAPASCSIIKRPPPKPVEAGYYDLICTDEDRANIHEIVSTVAEKSKVSLLFNQTYLREKGAAVTHVHPLRFMGVIFSDPYLKTCMFYICNDYWKRSSFVGDLSSALSREADKNNLHIYLNDFAKEVGVPYESLKGFIDNRDWDNLVLFLIQS